MRAVLADLLRRAADRAMTSPTIGCLPARALNALISKYGYRVEKDLAYGDERRQTLDIYFPDPMKPGAKVAVFFYGGRWTYGSKADYLFVGQALASAGVIAVIANYRLFPEVRFPTFVDDGAKAVAWVRRHIAKVSGDLRDMYLIGHSAGAYIAAMLALQKDFLAAEGMAADDLAGVIGLAGPYDFLPITAADIKEIFACPDLARTQPITFARGSAPPMLLLTGIDDTVVLSENSRQLAAAIKALGGDAEVGCYRRVGHVGVLLSVAAPFRWLAPSLKDMIAFIDRPNQAPPARPHGAGKAEHLSCSPFQVAGTDDLLLF